jgi:hypothetical protein
MGGEHGMGGEHDVEKRNDAHAGHGTPRGTE